MKILGKLFGSEARVKILRMFLFNPGTVYHPDDVALRTHVKKRLTSGELLTFRQIGLIYPRRFYREITKKEGQREIVVKRKAMGFVLDEDFAYLAPLRNLLINTSLLTHQEIIKRLNRAGKVKLVIISGVFIQEPESRVDILVVGDNLNKATVARVMGGIEAEIGRELRYAAFETSEFNYRLTMYDKLVRDILDYPHKKIFDRIGLSEK